MKYVIEGTRAAGGVISRHMVIAIGKGVVKSNKLEGTLEWARNVLKPMNWTKRKGTTGKVDPPDQFLMEEKLTLQREIASAIKEHDRPNPLIIRVTREIFIPQKSLF